MTPSKQKKIIDTFLSSHLISPGNGKRYFMVGLGTHKFHPDPKKIKYIFASWDQMGMHYHAVKVVENESKTHYHVAIYGKEEHIMYAPRKYLKNNYWHEKFDAYKKCKNSNITEVHKSSKFKNSAKGPLIYILDQKKSHPNALGIYSRISPALKLKIKGEKDDRLQQD